MKYEFSSQKELEKLLVSLGNNLTKGCLFTDEPDTDNEIIPSDYELPEEVKKFFYYNYIKACKLLNELPDPFFIKTSDCKWFYVNKAFCNFFDIRLKDIYGKTSEALFPKNKADLFYAQDKRLLATGKESVMEAEIINSTGHRRNILTKKTLFNDVNGTPYIIGIFNEVTGFKSIESSIKYEKTELEKLVKTRTGLLTATIEKLQEEINQRKKTELALIQEEDKFRNVIEQATDGIMLFDSQGRIIEWNDALTEITGIKNEQAIGKNIWDIEFQMMRPEKQTTDYYELLKKNTLTTLKKQEIPANIKNVEGIIIKSNKKQRYTSFTSFTIKTQKSFYIGRIVRDVTEEKKFIHSLQRSEAKYRNIFENSSVAILLINPENGKIIAANERAAEIYGYAINEFIGMPMMQITKDIDFELQQLKAIEKNESLKNFETIHLNKKGEEINMMVNGSMIEYEEINAIMIFNRDITELKRSEKARETVYKISQLTHTNTNTNDLYRSIHLIISEIIPANNFYIALYDDINDMISFPYFVDERDTTPETRRLRRGLTEYVLRHGEPILTNPEILEHLQETAEIELIGSISDTWLGVPLITHNKVIGVIAVQNYSEGIQFTNHEKDLLVFVSEQIANTIFKKQAEEQIIREKARAEESDRLKTALIANMNHDLRTPMTGILGFSSLLKKTITEPNAVMMIDTIIESGNKLMSTINSILQLSQLEASQKVLDIISGNLSKYAEMSLEQFEPKAKQKNLVVERNYQDKVFASFNENFLLQVLNNLITNAITYTEKGKITVNTGHTLYQEKEYAYISIADTGIGISKENYNLIFQEFRQVSEGLNRKYDGSGLGLSLCKKMTELMGGRIIIESSIGKGSVFTVLLPIASAQSPNSAFQKYEKESYKIEKKQKPKVLVVDDNKINGDLLFALLRKDYEVDIAKTGLLAIELVRRGSYDIVLLDINLGEGINGIQVAKEIQKIKSDLPLIAMTAYSTEKELKQIMKNYFSDYILKPIDKTALMKVLIKLLEEK